MSPKPVDDRTADGEIEDPTAPTSTPTAPATEARADVEEPGTSAASERRVWTSKEIAQLATQFDGDTDRLKASPPGDPVLRRLLANLGRRSKPPSGPIPERASSEGADYVVYSAMARPAPAYKEREPSEGGVIVQGFDATTEVLPRRRHWGTGRLGSVLQALILVAMGVVVGVVGSRFAGRAGTGSVHVDSAELGCACPTVMSAAAPVPSTGPAAGAGSTTPSSLSSAAGTHGGEGTTAPIVHRGAARAPATPQSKRPPDVQARRTESQRGDDVMEAVEY